MPCSKETLVMLFLNASSSFQLLFLFFYFSSILLTKFFRSRRWKTSTSSDDGCEIGSSSEEDSAFFHVECTEKEDHLVADIIRGGETLLFLPIKSPQKSHVLVKEEGLGSDDPVFEDPDETFTGEQVSVYSPTASESGDNIEETRDTDSATISEPNEDPSENVLMDKEEECDNKESGNVETNFSVEEKFLVFDPPQLDIKKFQVQEKDNGEIFGDSFTVGSTSKSSSEWRSSIINRDSGTEDPFSSSSRRSCPNWESYTVFQKYDEEMMFLDRISAQKLHETESFRAIEVCPKSISKRIVHKLTTRNKRSSDIHRNPYHELETAYVAQICLTWEALNWNYKNFQRLRTSQRELDPGCPAQIAQQFQQFQVLLQRYIENEPYENGRRPEVYARMRISAPNLLQVPEFRESDDDPKEGSFGAKIPSAAFLIIMKDAIRTFMNFLKADREKHYQIFTAFFKRNQRSSVDPTLLHLMKKTNRKKKMKLKDLRRSRKCLRKRRLKEEEEMEILMGLIDLKVVSRVLRMCEISEEQLQWCEEKMSKVRVWEGKLQRDSSQLFFSAH